MCRRWRNPACAASRPNSLCSSLHRPQRQSMSSSCSTVRSSRFSSCPTSRSAWRHSVSPRSAVPPTNWRQRSSRRPTNGGRSSSKPISKSTDLYFVNLRDITLRNARYQPGRAAVVFENHRCTHAAFASRAFRLANGLLGRGLRRGRIAVLAPNCLEYLEIFCACESANLIIVNMNYRLSAKELIDICRDCEPSALIFHAQFKDLAGELLRAVGTFRMSFCIGGTFHGGEAVEILGDGCSDAPPDVAIAAEDGAYLIYTSGTPGRPKGVLLSHAAIVESARCISHEGGAQSADVMLIVMPLFHIGARIEQLAFTILGATIVLHGSFDAVAILRSIAAEHVTAAHLAPIMIQRLLDSPDLASIDKSRV